MARQSSIDKGIILQSLTYRERLAGKLATRIYRISIKGDVGRGAWRESEDDIYFYILGHRFRSRGSEGFFWTAPFINHFAATL